MGGMMKAAVMRGLDQLVLEERKIPDVVPGSVLVRVKSCAICGSDVRILHHGNERVKPPRIIGHEISGEIVEVGAGVENFRVGDRVSVGADVPCGKCAHCLNGRANCCDTNLAIGYQWDGGFADYILLDPLVVSIGPLSTFSAGLSFDAAALAEPLGCCLNGYERAMMAPGRLVVIFGAGPIGMMLGMLASHFQASGVVMIDPQPVRLALAAKLIKGDFIDPTKKDPIEEIMKITGGAGADMIFTANTAVETHEQAVQMLAKRGVVNFFGGLGKTARPISLSSNLLHYREAYVMGSHGATPAHHRQALALIESGKVKVESLVTSRHSLSDIAGAFKAATALQGHKTVVNPHG